MPNRAIKNQQRQTKSSNSNIAYICILSLYGGDDQDAIATGFINIVRENIEWIIAMYFIYLLYDFCLTIYLKSKMSVTSGNGIILINRKKHLTCGTDTF